MRPLVLSLLLLLSGGLIAAETYIGAGGGIDLPMGGSRHMPLTGGVQVRGGGYFTDNTALEGEVGWQGPLWSVGLGLLTHASAWSVYDRFFGYSAFDPFVTCGARGWVGDGKGQVGPAAGFGAFYHFDDRWSLRAETSLTLGVDSRIETVFGFAVGIQCRF